MAVDFVLLVEFAAGWGDERGKLTHCLSRQRATVDEKEDSAGRFGFQQPVAQRHHGKGLAGSGRHGQKHGPLAFGHGRFHCVDGLVLIGAQVPDADRVGHERLKTRSRFAFIELCHGIRSVEGSKSPGNIPGVAHIDEPDDLTVGRVKKRDSITLPVAAAAVGSFRVTFGLFENILRTDLDPFGLEDAQQSAFDKQRIVGRAVGGRVFLDGMAIQSRNIQVTCILDDLPGRLQGFQLLVDAIPSGLPLVLVNHSNSSMRQNSRSSSRFADEIGKIHPWSGPSWTIVPQERRRLGYVFDGTCGQSANRLRWVRAGH